MQQRPDVLVNVAVTADGTSDAHEQRGARIADLDASLSGGALLAEHQRLTVRDPGRSLSVGGAQA